MPSDDFRGRTFRFGVRCVRLAEALPKGLSGQICGKQLLRSGTSVGANYRSATRARSRADFVARMGIVEEECDEVLYWIEMLVELGLIPAERVQDLVREAGEILAITVSSIKTARVNGKRLKSARADNVLNEMPAFSYQSRSADLPSPAPKNPEPALAAPENF